MNTGKKVRRRRIIAAAVVALLVSGVFAATRAQAAPSGDSAQPQTVRLARPNNGSEVKSVTPGLAPAPQVPRFLKLPFRKQDGKGALFVTQGWLTANDEIPITGDDSPHTSLDFEFYNTHDHGQGLPVLAAADGWAYYSYQYVAGSFTAPDGVTHQVGWGAGIVVEIQHANGWVTQYIHLSKVAKGVPYLGATKQAGDDWSPSGILQPRDVLISKGKHVKQGQVIGYMGDTGIGYDWVDQFDPATGTVAPRDRVALPGWDPTQLHFNFYHGRDADMVKQDQADSSGVYGRITATTNPYMGDKAGQLRIVRAQSAWLTDANGHPQYAAK